MSLHQALGDGETKPGATGAGCFLETIEYIGRATLLQPLGKPRVVRADADGDRREDQRSTIPIPIPVASSPRFRRFQLTAISRLSLEREETVKFTWRVREPLATSD
ncbi:MAG TPA: hypothetical protein VGZ50_02645 [Actinomycetota bacterium]|nr:hypothetical protein [Actinomycetota bacterium]